MLWIAIRLALWTAFALAGRDIAHWYSEPSSRPVALPFILMLVIGFATVLGLGFLNWLGRAESLHWRRPSWREKPLSAGPAQAFFTLGSCFVAAGCGGLVAAASDSGSSLVGGAVTLGFGTGLLLGSYSLVPLLPRAFSAS